MARRFTGKHLPLRRSEQVYGEFYVWGQPTQRHRNQTLSQATESMTSLCYRSIATYINEDKLQALQAFLENKQVQVDDRDDNGATALMLAASKGRIAFACELLVHGANPNAEDDDGWSPLLCAAKEGHADVCHELLEHGASIDHRDMGGWTALMWATYKGRVDVALLLLDKGADINAHGNYHISSLLWAAGRGYTSIAQALIAHGAKVNVGDKYGTTALVWASRKGYVEIVDSLLHAGANVDTAGMYSWTALLVATQGNHIEVVNMLLEHKPNANALDKDGCSALTIACKEGYYEIASALMNFGAYINVQDRVGDTNLIHAIKGGHRGVVEALLKKYADVDICGKDRKTALYIAVEKGNVPIVKMLLNANPDLEVATKDGDTPLLKAVRSRNSEIVQLLLDKKAKVSATDKKGDTALHIAMRARSKGIVEILLRNPKHSQLLYRPNRSGETPYNIDIGHQKTILGQIFGARRLNTNEDNENMLGYDLYSSALADILSEPSLSMPITVGLYAKWGSGKSFLLNKLREEMKNFAREWEDPRFQFSSLLFLFVLHVAIIAGAIIGVSILNWIAGLLLTAFIIFSSYIFLASVWFASKRYDWDWPYNFSIKLTRTLNGLKLVLQILFCHPPGTSADSHVVSVQPIKFYFTDQTRVSSTVAGESCAVQICGSLYDAIEKDYGTMATRLYRAFKPKPSKSSNWKWRRICCLPNILIFEVTLICFLTVICALTVFLLRHETNAFTDLERLTLNVVMLATALPVGVVTVANFYTWNKMFMSLFFSQRKHLQRTISKMESVKSEGFFQCLKDEVNLMKNMVKCLDSLSSQQTRLVIIVDGLDSCEQDKVLLVLDAVHLLFSDANSPFIVILAIDPHVIAKAVEINSRRLFSESNIDGHSYLNNMVHLPFYLQNSGLRKVKIAQQTAQSHRKPPGTTSSGFDLEDNINLAGNNLLGRSLSSRRLSTESALMSSTEKLKFGARKGSRKLKLSESVASSIGSNLNKIGGAQDLTKMLLTDDYFSDVNPKSMRRLMNVVYVTGRLLKAFQIDFNWYRLASWINITEQWPFRTSWIIYHYDTFEDNLDDNTSLKSIYEKIRPFLPSLKVIEPLLELDRDERKLDIFLSFHRSSLLVSDLKIFLPFTINLDPYLKKVIKEEAQVLEDDDTGLNMSQTSFMGASGLASANFGWNAPPDWNSPPMTASRRSKNLQARLNPQPTPPVVYQTSNMNWSQPWNDMMAASQPYGLGPVTELSPEVLESKLSTLSVEGVAKLVDSIGESDPSMLAMYKKVIRDNNVSGRVLLHCNLDELKNLLKMNFGDWEMFRMLIVSMRTYELTAAIKQTETKQHAPRPSHGGYSRERKASVTKMEKESGSKSQIDGSVNKNKQNIIEKQITLEDQMICGALQTLNEEACEDVIEETEDVKYPDNIPRTSIIPPSPDNAISDVYTGETDYVILQSSPIGHVSWHPISISVCGNTESLSDTASLANSQPPSPGPVDRVTGSDFVKIERLFNRSEKSLQRPSSLYLFNEDPRDASNVYKVRSKSVDNSQAIIIERKSSFGTGRTQFRFRNRLLLDPDAVDSETLPLVTSPNTVTDKQISTADLSSKGSLSDDMRSCSSRLSKHEQTVPLLSNEACSSEDASPLGVFALSAKHSRSCGQLSGVYDSIKNLVKENESSAGTQV